MDVAEVNNGGKRISPPGMDSNGAKGLIFFRIKLDYSQYIKNLHIKKAHIRATKTNAAGIWAAINSLRVFYAYCALITFWVISLFPCVIFTM